MRPKNFFTELQGEMRLQTEQHERGQLRTQFAMVLQDPVSLGLLTSEEKEMLKGLQSGVEQFIGKYRGCVYMTQENPTSEQVPEAMKGDMKALYEKAYRCCNKVQEGQCSSAVIAPSGIVVRFGEELRRLKVFEKLPHEEQLEREMERDREAARVREEGERRAQNNQVGQHLPRRPNSQRVNIPFSGSRSAINRAFQRGGNPYNRVNIPFGGSRPAINRAFQRGGNPYNAEMANDVTRFIANNISGSVPGIGCNIF